MLPTGFYESRFSLNELNQKHSRADQIPKAPIQKAFRAKSAKIRANSVDHPEPKASITLEAKSFDHPEQIAPLLLI